MMDDTTFWTGCGGIVLGFLFGLVMQRSRFCMVAAVSNLLLIRDGRHVQAFLAAWAVAIAAPPCWKARSASPSGIPPAEEPGSRPAGPAR